MIDTRQIILLLAAFPPLVLATSPASAQSSNVVGPEFSNLRPFIYVRGAETSQAQQSRQGPVGPAAYYPAPDNWADRADYPPEAVAARREGSQILMLDVDATGRVVRCRLSAPSEYAPFDRLTCSWLRKRAQLAPALDAENRPVVGSVEIRVFYWLAPRAPRFGGT